MEKTMKTLFIMLLLLIYVSLGTAQTLIRPIGWIEIDSLGTLLNPEQAYDNDFRDFQTFAAINSEGYYETVEFGFHLEQIPEEFELYYIRQVNGAGRGIEMPGSTSILFYDQNTQSWISRLRITRDEPAELRMLPCTPRDINWEGILRVRFQTVCGRNMPGPGPGEYPVNVSLYDLYISLDIEQERTLHVDFRRNYYELMAFNIVPPSLNADNIFFDLPHLEIVYQDDGRIYIPVFVNTIFNITLTEGYQVFCSDVSELEITAPPLDPETVYPLFRRRWNWLGYPFDYVEDTVALFGEYEQYSPVILNDNGEIHIAPAMLSFLARPGEAFFIFVSEDIDLQFPDTGGIPQLKPIPQTPPLPVNCCITPTGLPYAVIIEMAETLRQQKPAQVELYDGELLVGASIVDESKDVVAVTAWEGSPEHGLPGFVEGHPIAVRVLAANGTLLYVAENSGARFGDDPYSTITLNYSPSTSIALPEKFEMLPVYPNPFNSTIVIPFVLPNDGDVNLVCYNLQGQQVYQKALTFTTAGAQQFTLDVSPLNLGTGIYLIKTSYSKTQQVQKVIYLK